MNAAYAAQSSMEYLPAIVLGWPGAILGAVFLVVGAATRKGRLSVIGAVIATGIVAYAILLPPPIRWLGLAALAGNYLSPVPIRRYGVVGSAALLIPFILLMITLAHAVITQ